jgi:predicted kinase
VDCIEFNERFRFIDPVADMAFLVMDLVLHGRRDLADVFTAAYFRASGDSEGQQLVPLYTAYRAAVRGSVEGILAGEEEAKPSEREAARERARAHWLLALSTLQQPPSRPGLVLVSGLPGTGKSWLAGKLAGAADFCLLRADVVRKELAGLSPDAATPESLREQLYAPEASDRTYAECLRRAEALLFEGKRALVDATFRQERYRQLFVQAAGRWGVPVCMLLCQADPETVRQRLEGRRGDASDADWSVHLQLAAGWEELSAATSGVARTIRTEGCAEEVVGEALQALARVGLWQ